MHRLCKATYTDYSRICRVWIYSELSDVTQGCLGNITTTREELPPGRWVSPGKHSHTHSLHSQAQCHLIGKMYDFYYSAQLRRLLVLCKFLWNFDDVSSCIDSLKMRWWKSLLVVRVCLANTWSEYCCNIILCFNSVLANLPFCSYGQGISRCRSTILTV